MMSITENEKYKFCSHLFDCTSTAFKSRFHSMLKAKPCNLRVRIPPNEFGDFPAKPQQPSCINEGFSLGLTGPLRGLRSLNKRLDEALELLPLGVPTGVAPARNKFYSRKTVSPEPSVDYKSASGCVREELQQYQIHYVDSSATAAMVPVTVTSADRRSRSSMASAKLALEAAMKENKTLREALIALRDVLFFEIRKREKAEVLYRRLKLRLEATEGGGGGSVGGGSRGGQSMTVQQHGLIYGSQPLERSEPMEFGETRHYSIQCDHQRQPSVRVIQAGSASPSRSLSYVFPAYRP